MKVLLATYWALPHLGGVWPYMNEVKRKLESLGHEVDIMGHTPDGKGLHIVNQERVVQYELLRPLLEAKLTAETTPLMYAHPWIYEYELNRYCLELASAYFGVEQYDVIHTQDVLSTCAMKRIKSQTTPLVVSIHGSIAKEGEALLQRIGNQFSAEQQTYANNFFQRIEYFGAVSSDRTITSSQWLKNALVSEYGIPYEHISVFQYGMDTQQFLKRMEESTTMERPAGKKVILYTGRLYYMKGLHNLLNALAVLKQQRSDWVCWLVGGGDPQEAANLQQQCEKLGLQEDVLFLGYRNDVPALLRQSDIYVLPTLIDNQPFSLMEAQVAGRPVIVTDAGGVPEMVAHGETGLVYRAGDEQGLLSYLQLLLNNESLRQQLGFNARQWGLEHWSIDTMVDRLLGVYTDLQKGGR